MSWVGHATSGRGAYKGAADQLADGVLDLMNRVMNSIRQRFPERRPLCRRGRTANCFRTIINRIIIDNPVFGHFHNRQNVTSLSYTGFQKADQVHAGVGKRTSLEKRSRHAIVVNGQIRKHSVLIIV